MSCIKSKISSLVIFSTLAFSLGALGQSAENVLSIYGSGFQDTNLSIRGFMMGDAGSAAPVSILANYANPAMLSYLPYTQLEVGYYADRRNQFLNGREQLSFGGNLGYFSLAFPVSNKVRTAIQLKSIATSDFNFSTLSPIQGSTQGSVIEDRDQSGSLTEVSLKNSLFVAKGLSLGLAANFLFGNRIIESFNYLAGVPTSFNYRFKSKTNYKGLSIQPGIQYAYRKNKNALSIGLAHTFNYSLSAENLISTSYVANAGRGQGLDTLVNTEFSNSLKRPGSTLLGLAYTISDKFTIASDYFVRNWSSFVNEEEELRLGDNWYTGFGLEYTPNYNSIQSYLARVTYRVGVKYESRAFIQPDQLNEVETISYRGGLSLPFRRGSSYINLGGEYTTAIGNSFIDEDYFRVYFSLTFNDQWFIQRKFD